MAQVVWESIQNNICICTNDMDPNSYFTRQALHTPQIIGLLLNWGLLNFYVPVTKQKHTYNFKGIHILLKL